MCLLLIVSSCKKDNSSSGSNSPIHYFTEFGSFNVERVRVFSNGTTVMVGEAHEGAVILALDYGGKYLWHHMVHGEGSSIYLDVALLNNGNYMAIGYTNARDLGANGLGNNPMINSYSPTGSPDIKVMQTSYEVEFTALCQLSNGSVMVVGNTRKDHYRSLLVNFDADRNINWSNEFTIGPWHSKCLEVLELQDGSCAVLGYRSYSSLATEVSKYSTYYLKVQSGNGSLLKIVSYLDHKREALLSTYLPERIRALATSDGLCWATTEEEDNMKVGIHWMHVTDQGDVIDQSRIYGLNNSTVEGLQKLSEGHYLIVGGTTDGDAGSISNAFRSQKYMLWETDLAGNELNHFYLGDDIQIQTALGVVKNLKGLNVFGMQEQNVSGLRHPCYFGIDTIGRFVLP
ncbi:MAG: hypothetical protein GC180_03750 [Bacteroidetes bacterium]|nr:hypothetical protein [Bacteroidota bacterium]